MYSVTSLRILAICILGISACSESSSCPTEGAIKLDGVCDCPPALPKYDTLRDRCFSDDAGADVGDTRGPGMVDGGSDGVRGDMSSSGDGAVSGNGDAGAALASLQLAAGGVHSCRLLGDSLGCWGANVAGELGRIAPSDAVIKTVAGVVDAVQISLGWQHSCARLKNQTVACWGNNESGQLGDRTRNSRPDPQPVVELAEVVELVAGYEHNCARLVSGSVQCWGRNIVGQLGDGTDLTRLAPVLVSGLSNVVEIAAGAAHTCARHTSGTVSCWGGNYSGQLGDGTTIDRGTPLEVPGLSGVVGIAAGGDHTCVHLASGQVSCWGRNQEGQLGDATPMLRSTPAAVVGLSGVVELVAGRGHTCARRESGLVSCWGSNASGELGVGVKAETLAISRSPLDVVGLTDAADIASGADHVCARRANGKLVCWGANASQQVGDGSNTNRNVPTIVRGE